MAGIKLNDFQNAFLKWAIDKKSVLCRARTGAGKSISAFALFAVHRKQLGFQHMVVIAKTKTLESFKKVNPQNLNIHMITSEKDLLIFHKDSPLTSDVYMISNVQAKNLVKSGTPEQKISFFSLLKKPSLLIIDELADYRNITQADGAKSILKIVQAYHREIEADPVHHRFVGLTASPVTRALEDLFPMSKFVAPRLFPSYFAFMNRYVIREDRDAFVTRKVKTANGVRGVKQQHTFSQIVGYQNQDELFHLLEPYMFVWNNTDFQFNFELVEYHFTEDEEIRYQSIISREGLDKMYLVKVVDSDGVEKSIPCAKTDTLRMAAGNFLEVRQIPLNSNLIYDNKTYTVVDIQSRKADGNAALAFLKAQTEIISQDKFQHIAQIIRDGNGKGVFIYSHFLKQQDAIYSFLLEQFPDRHIVKADGQTQNFDKLVRSLPTNSIFLGSDVAVQSINLYQEILILASPMSVPGKLIQLFGRVSRFDAAHREVDIKLLYRDRSVDDYLFSMAQYRMSFDKDSPYRETFPVTPFVASLPLSQRNLSVYKQEILWRSIS